MHLSILAKVQFKPFRSITKQNLSQARKTHLLLTSIPSLGQHSEGVILGSPQNVDEVGGVAGAFIPQSSDRPNASYAALTLKGTPSDKDTAPHNARSDRYSLFAVPFNSSFW